MAETVTWRSGHLPFAGALRKSVDVRLDSPERLSRSQVAAELQEGRPSVFRLRRRRLLDRQPGVRLDRLRLTLGIRAVDRRAETGVPRLVETVNVQRRTMRIDHRLHLVHADEAEV